MPGQFIVAFANRKGGVGKTTSAVNISGVVAAAGKRVLLIDLDQQDSCGELLGTNESDGRSMLEAITQGTQPQVIRDVRPRLDLIAGGVDLGELSERLRHIDGWSEYVAEALSRIIEEAGEYDLVVIDTPPGDIMLTRAAMMVSKHLVIPVKASRMALSAMQRTAQVFVQACEHNPTLRLAGAFFFDVDRSATAVNADKRKQLQRILGESAPVFDAQIHHSSRYDSIAGDRGLLAYELENQSDAARVEIFAALRKGKTASDANPAERPAFVGTAAGIASDFHDLTLEILAAMRDQTGE
jgi:cellulose biosynthesis protein BcsQ